MLSENWLAVAVSEEIGSETPVAVTANGLHLALFRDKEGIVRAVEDRCPHRRVPLSLGKVIDGALRCAYHGWTFEGAGGKCVDVPNLGENERVPPSFSVNAYSVTEHEGFVSVWPSADTPSLSMPFENETQDSWAVETFGSGVAALGYYDYRDLLLDGPQVLFEIPGVRFTDFYLGDALVLDGKITLDREAEWGSARKPVDIKKADRPLVLRTELTLDSGQAAVRLFDIDEQELARLLISFTPGKRGTTSYCWRFYRHKQFTATQPIKSRLLASGQQAVAVSRSLDGSEVASILVGPSSEFHQTETDSKELNLGASQDEC